MTEIDELSKKIDHLTDLTEDNSAKLHKLHRDMVLGRIWKIVYWTVIIGAAIGAFYFLQPYLETFIDVYGQVSETRSDLEGLFNSNSETPR
jgi:hypothetical protein